MKLNIFFKCKTCFGSGWASPNVPCQVCKGTGQVLHQFKDAIKVEQFPEGFECVDAEVVVKEAPSAPNTSSN